MFWTEILNVSIYLLWNQISPLSKETHLWKRKSHLSSASRPRPAAAGSPGCAPGCEPAMEFSFWSSFNNMVFGIWWLIMWIWPPGVLPGSSLLRLRCKAFQSLHCQRWQRGYTHSLDPTRNAHQLMEYSAMYSPIYLLIHSPPYSPPVYSPPVNEIHLQVLLLLPHAHHLPHLHPRLLLTHAGKHQESD